VKPRGNSVLPGSHIQCLKMQEMMAMSSVVNFCNLYPASNYHNCWRSFNLFSVANNKEFLLLKR